MASSRASRLIVGTAGVLYREVSNWFLEAGLDLGYERIGRLGAIGWMYAVVDREAAYPWQHGIRPEETLTSQRFLRILHQVRHPLDSITALLTLSDSSWQFIAKHTTAVNLLQVRPWVYGSTPGRAGSETSRGLVLESMSVSRIVGLTRPSPCPRPLRPLEHHGSRRDVACLAFRQLVDTDCIAL